METQYHLHIPRPRPLSELHRGGPAGQPQASSQTTQNSITAPHHQHEHRSSHDHSPAPGLSSDSQQLDPTGVGSDTGDGSSS
jgi:hypothetical protein